MTKKLLSLIFSLQTIFVCGQTTDSEMLTDKYKCGSNYYAYMQVPGKKTDAPKGFKPFYISHYGRHGSRYHYSADDFKNMYNLFAKADSANALSEKGKSVLERFRLIYEDGKLKAGDLTQKGAEQHRGIARRMAKDYPEVFKSNAKIDVISSTSARVLLSMNAFCLELKEQHPKICIKTESGLSVMNFINHEDKSKDKRLSLVSWTKQFDEMHKKLVHPERILNLLFSDSNYVKSNIDSIKLIRKFYELNSSLQGMDSLNVNFDDIWTSEELLNNWKVQNAWWYAAYARCPLTEGKNAFMAENLLNNILAESRKAINNKGACATLRFGHDTGLLPLAALLKIGTCGIETADLYNLHKHWCDYKIIPMAGNIQFIFYKNKENDVLVKILLNEQETTLPIKAVNNVYYKWNDFEEYCQSLSTNIL